MLYLLIRAGFEPFRARVIAPRSPTQTSPPDHLAPGFWLLDSGSWLLAPGSSALGKTIA